VYQFKYTLNPERVRLVRNPFRVGTTLVNVIPGFSLALESWAEVSERLRRYDGLGLANAFGVFSN
jgi:hypothetical protein